MKTTSTDVVSSVSEGPGLACCRSCLGTPCGDLRFGGAPPGGFRLVHRSRFGSGTDECPFLEHRWLAIERALGRLTFSKLSMLVSRFIGDLSEIELIRWRQRHFVQGYPDSAGRIEFIRALWCGGVASMIRVPSFCENDPVLTRWLNDFEAPPERRSGPRSGADR